jgi:hypothetical protein
MIQVLAVLSIAVCLIPAGAHFFELPNKMSLPPDQYMVVQHIYAGWALFGIVIFAALIFTAWHTYLMRADQNAFNWSATAFSCMIATQVIFWTFTYPMNVATSNWTAMPENFEAVRRQWEYSHAISALLTFFAFTAITLSVLADKRPFGLARVAELGDSL